MKREEFKKLIKESVKEAVREELVSSLLEVLKEHNKIELPKTEQISEQILTLPLYPNMTKDEIEYLTNSISEFFED